MISHLPTLDPALLERCLALSEQLAMKSGAAKLEISPSHFVFSVNQFPGNKETGATSSTSTKLKRKKTPSDMRRNTARQAKFLKEKNLAKSSSSKSPVNQSDITEVPLDLSKPSTTIPDEIPDEISQENSSDSTKESRSSNEISRNILPRNNSSETEVHMEVDQPSSMNTPLPSPAQPKNTDQEGKHPKEVDLNSDVERKCATSNPTNKSLTELHLSVCSADQEESYQFGNKFKRSTYLGPHPRNKNHFLYAVHLDDINVNHMKTMINEFNEKKNLIKIRIPSENKNYFPDKQNHCQECVNLHVKK